MGNGPLDLRHHVILRHPILILRPWSPILRDHAHELDVAGHDGGHGGDEARAQEEVGEARDVGEGLGRGEAGGEEIGAEGDRGEEVEDVEAPGEGVEGDWEVD